MDALAALVRFAEAESRAVVEHKLRFHGDPPGIWDEVWIPKAGKEGWIIISADRGKKGGTKKGDKLPRVCRANNVTHVLMSPAVKQQKQFDQVLVLLSVWYRLLETIAAPPGTCFSLEPLERGRGILKEKVPPTPSPANVREPVQEIPPKAKHPRSAKPKSKKKRAADGPQRRLFDT
jgi:hypothetical protein